MNTRNITSILMDNCKTVKVSFDSNIGAKKKDSVLKSNGMGDSRTYTYKTTMDFQEGDLAIVEVNGKLKVVTVVQVDDFADIDLHATYDYKWIIQKINLTDYNYLVSLENTFSKELRLLEQKAVRENTKEMLVKSMGISEDGLNTLTKKLNKKVK